MEKNGKVYIRIRFGEFDKIDYKELKKRCKARKTRKIYRDKLFYPLNGILMEVTKEEYKDFYKTDRRQKYLLEEAILHDEVSFNTLDTEEMNGEETVIDPNADIEKTVETEIMIEQLKKCLTLLTNDEYNLIYALFYKGLSERELSKSTGIPPMTLHDRKVNILLKLKKILKI
jgi:RNA polymerase sigma factor (sigma-70 family)